MPTPDWMRLLPIPTENSNRSTLEKQSSKQGVVQNAAKSSSKEPSAGTSKANFKKGSRKADYPVVTQIKPPKQAVSTKKRAKDVEKLHDFDPRRPKEAYEILKKKYLFQRIKGLSPLFDVPEDRKVRD